MNNNTEHLVRFYPVGNGDTSQIILHNGKRILVDFFHSKAGEDENHPKIHLRKTIKEELEDVNRDYFDVVMFTHGDKDHIDNSDDFFEFDWAKKYQGNGRIKINMLYVPAAMILESRNDVYCKVVQEEARYRLKKGYGILVFSKPNELKDWLEKNELSVEKRKDCLIDAGEIIPHFNLKEDGVEFFVHAPFIKHVDDNEKIERNEAAIILHATFEVKNQETRFFMFGDSEYEVLEDIVDITENGIHKDEKRLKWDIYNIPHHCSYLALNSEKGDEKTEPTEKIKKLLNYGNKGSIFISSSNPIEVKQKPPYIEAYNCYKEYNAKKGGRGVIVTMEYPNEENPEFIEIIIDKNGYRLGDFSEKEEYINNNFPINLTHKLKINCEVSQKGFRDSLLSHILFLQANKELRFFIESTNVIKPYSVKWKVKNRGATARKLNALRGEISDDKGYEEKIEHTKYKGSHYVVCYIIKNGVCVAKDKIEVPIEINRRR